MGMSFAQTELHNRKKELNDKILKAVESAQSHDLSLDEICSTLDVTRRTLGRMRAGQLEDVSYDSLFLVAVGLGMQVNISVPRVLS